MDGNHTVRIGSFCSYLPRNVYPTTHKRGEIILENNHHLTIDQCCLSIGKAWLILLYIFLLEPIMFCKKHPADKYSNTKRYQSNKLLASSIHMLENIQNCLHGHIQKRWNHWLETMVFLKFRFNVPLFFFSLSLSLYFLFLFLF